MIADVRCSCGRSVLYVAGIAIAMEGDRCRTDAIPEEFLPAIPEEELATATIGDKRAKDLPIDIVRFFRGDNWNQDMLQWVADKINAVAKETAP